MVSGDSVDVTLKGFGITSLPSRRMENFKFYEYLVDIFLQVCLSWLVFAFCWFINMFLWFGLGCNSVPCLSVFTLEFGFSRSYLRFCKLDGKNRINTWRKNSKGIWRFLRIEIKFNIIHIYICDMFMKIGWKCYLKWQKILPPNNGCQKVIIF